MRRNAVRLFLVLALAAGTVALISAPQPNYPTKHDKAFYLSDAQANFIRPGFTIKIQSASIANDGTITAQVSITDPANQPLDMAGIQSAGTVSMSFVAATIPAGKTQYTSYTSRVSNSIDGTKSAVQAGADSGGTYANPSPGVYTYTFKTKAPTNFDTTATHTIGVYGSRNLTTFSLGTQYASDVLTFVPNGSPVTVTRDVIRTQSCDKCHDQLSFHGGSRRGMQLCILCHTPQTSDPNTGNTVDLPVMIHKIHMGKGLTKPYTIVGFGNAVSDWSGVTFPANPGDPRQCQVCHEQTTGAAQAKAFLNPSTVACGACHDNVNLASGLNHAGGPQPDDKLCSNCHIPQGELEFDASILGAHANPTQSSTLPGIVMHVVKVDNYGPGQKPIVTFTVKDKAGNVIPLNTLTASPNSASLIMAGPTTDYGYTSFGSDLATPGYVSESVVTAAKCGTDGTCTYQFTHAIPANAKGSYAIATQARRGATLLPGTVKQMSTEYGAKNEVTYFSVDGTKTMQRRTVVDVNKCNQCHQYLSLHGENRNQIEFCVMCHNPSENDASTRPSATTAADKALPPQSVDFALMIHRIHTGVNMQADGRTYVIVGFGGSHNDFTDVRYPAMGPTGNVHDTRNCQMCHVNGSESLPLQPGPQNQVKDPQGLINPAGYTTAACTGCHTSVAAASHALTNTSSQLGEACIVCHDTTAQFSVDQVHAQ